MVELYNDNCLKIMKEIPDRSIDLILCDLPYGTTKCSWDIIISFDDLWKQYKRIIKDNGAIVLFGQEPFSSLLRTSNLDMYKYDIYWEKERLTNIMQVKKRVGKTIENISVFYKNQPTYNPQMVKYDGKPRTNKVKNGKLGSGSTGVACINTNRNFIGIELNEKYFNIATERINSNIKK